MMYQSVKILLAGTLAIGLSGCNTVKQSSTSAKIYFSHAVPEKSRNMIKPSSVLNSLDNLDELTVYFANDSSEVIASEGIRIQSFIEERSLGAWPVLTVSGHTDSNNSNNYNLSLGDRRARAVLLEIERLGYPKELATTQSLGEAEPVESNNTDQGRQKNRRVIISVGNNF